MRKSRDKLNAEWAKRCCCCCCCDSTVRHLMGYSGQFEKQSLTVRQSEYIQYATLSGHGKKKKKKKFKTWNSLGLRLLTTGITVLETCLLLDKQTATERVLRSVIHRLFHVLCASLQYYP
jgi:hypothetical protein